jgi:exopolysaccharide biosynthesis operon protein EpsL
MVQGWLRPVAAYFSMAGFLAGPASAAPGDVLTAVLSGYVIHDANFFRLPDSVDPQAAEGKARKSDTTKVFSAGLRFDKLYMQQRFQVDVTETRFRHEDNSQLDLDALEYRGAWLFHMTPRVSGRLSAERKQVPVPFADVPGSQRNVRTTDSRNLNLAWWAFGGWHLLLETSQKEQKSEVLTLAENDFQFTGAAAGVRYTAGSGNSIAVSQHARRGDYLNRPIDAATFLDNNFREYESELNLSWIPTGRSTLNGRLGWLERRHEHFAQRDFSGLIGDLSYGWTATGKLRVSASAKREMTAASELFSSYRVSDTLSVTPSWQTSAKTSVRLAFSHAVNDFRGPVLSPPGPLRRDTTRTAMLSADWAPWTSILLSVSVQRQGRSSNIPEFGFDTTIVALGAVFNL